MSDGADRWAAHCTAVRPTNGSRHRLAGAFLIALLTAAAPAAIRAAECPTDEIVPRIPAARKPFDDARFDFFGTVLTGQELPRVRWKRGVSMVNAYLGDAIGKLYVEKHFPPEAKARVQEGQFRGNAVRPEFARTMVQGDPHPIGKFRVIGPVSNLPEFPQGVRVPHGIADGAAGRAPGLKHPR